MDKKIIQKLEEMARRINFGNYNAKFVVNRGEIIKIIVYGTEEELLVDYKFDRHQKK